MDNFGFILQYSDMGLAVLRLAVGVLFLKHGMMKLGMWKMQPSDQMPSSMLNMMRVLSIVESIAGLAMIAGLFTQLVAVVFCIVMLGAMYYKIYKWKKTFAGDGGWELDFVLLAANIALILGGGGAWGLDKLVLS